MKTFIIAFVLLPLILAGSFVIPEYKFDNTKPTNENIEALIATAKNDISAATKYVQKTLPDKLEKLNKALIHVQDRCKLLKDSKSSLLQVSGHESKKMMGHQLLVKKTQEEVSNLVASECEDSFACKDLILVNLEKSLAADCNSDHSQFCKNAKGTIKDISNYIEWLSPAITKAYLEGSLQERLGALISFQRGEAGSEEEYYYGGYSHEEYYYRPSSQEEYYYGGSSSEEYYYRPSSEEEYYYGGHEEYYYGGSSSEEYYYRPSSEEEYYYGGYSHEEYYYGGPSSEEYYYGGYGHEEYYYGGPSSEEYYYRPSSEEEYYYGGYGHEEYYYGGSSSEEYYYRPSSEEEYYYGGYGHEEYYYGGPSSEEYYYGGYSHEEEYYYGGPSHEEEYHYGGYSHEEEYYYNNSTTTSGLAPEKEEQYSEAVVSKKEKHEKAKSSHKSSKKSNKSKKD